MYETKKSHIKSNENQIKPNKNYFKSNKSLIKYNGNQIKKLKTHSIEYKPLWIKRKSDKIKK